MKVNVALVMFDSARLLSSSAHDVFRLAVVLFSPAISVSEASVELDTDQSECRIADREADGAELRGKSPPLRL